MLVTHTALLGKRVLSLRSFAPIGYIADIVVDPKNLHIEAFYVRVDQKTHLLLLAQDVRELLPRGCVVNDLNDLSPAEDLIRLQPLLKLNFILLGKPVYAGTKKVGKVTNYSADDKGLFVQKLYVQPPLLQSFIVSELTIDRRAIIEVTSKKILIADDTQKVSASEAVTAHSSGSLVPEYSTASSAKTSLTSE